MSKQKERKTMNARFFLYWNQSYVKITMEPGDEMAFGRSQAHEEGFSAEYVSLTFDGFEVERESHTRAKDCDGFTSDTRTSSCRLANLATGWKCLDDDMKPIDGMRQPKWEDGASSRYDQYAQAANY